MSRRGNWIALGVAVVVAVIIVAVSASNWFSIGDAGIDLNGWIALILGVVATFALGVGLMALIFISSRRGYDDPSDRDR